MSSEQELNSASKNSETAARSDQVPVTGEARDVHNGHEPMTSAYVQSSTRTQAVSDSKSEREESVGGATYCTNGQPQDSHRDPRSSAASNSVNHREGATGRTLLQPSFPVQVEAQSVISGGVDGSASSLSLLGASFPHPKDISSGARGAWVDGHERAKVISGLEKGGSVRAASSAQLPKGMTGELMRQVAALDVSRISCEQITEWFEKEDTEGKMQHRVLGINGKGLLHALHEAPEDMAAWLDPTSVEAMMYKEKESERFKSLQDGLVRILADSSGKLTEIQGLKLAKKIKHRKQVWSATWKLVARGCFEGVTVLRCLVRTLLWRMRVGGQSGALDDLEVFADYLRFLLIPSQVFKVTGTAVAKSLSGYLELILKRSNGAPYDESPERCLQSLVGVLCTLCPLGDARDTSSTSEAGRRLGDVCTVALPVLCPCLQKFQMMHTRCVVSSFLSNLSWHDDNKIQMHQTGGEVVPHVMLLWLCDENMREAAKGDKSVALARLNMATVIWNLSKRAENAAGLVQPELFDLLFSLLCRDDEEGDVLRRIVSCVQNVASMRRCASELTDFIAMKTSVSNFLGTLFGLLGRRGGRNMHQRVLGTFANLAYLCVLGDSSAAWARLLREILKEFMSNFSETSDIFGNFNLDSLEAQDRQLKFQSVRFEIARFLWCMIRLEVCHGASVKRLAAYISELDVLGASAGVLYENVPRACLKHYEVVDLLQCVATPIGGHAYNNHRLSGSYEHDEGGNPLQQTNSPSEKEMADTVRTFALWILAHYTSRTDDRVHVASHGGLKVLTSILMGPGGLIETVKADGERVPRQMFINFKLAAKTLANLCQAPQNAELVESAGVLPAIEAMYSFVATSSSFHRAQESCVPPRYKIDPDYKKRYLVVQENLWRPVVKEPVENSDGSVQVFYEVPAGNNERLELSKKVTPQDIEGKEFQVLQGEVPHQINVLDEVAACLNALAMHTSVLKLFASSGVLGPFLQLGQGELIPRGICLSALLDIPVKSFSQRPDVMRHLWSMITSTVLEPEEELPGEKDTDDGEDQDDTSITSRAGLLHNEEPPIDSDEMPNTAEERTKLPEENLTETAAWSSRLAQAKNEQALAVRVLDRLVTGADEDAFESAENGGDDRPSDAREATKRSISNLLIIGAERRQSEEYRRHSVLMTSGQAYTISGILNHQLLFSGIIAPSGKSERGWRRLSADLAAQIESAQRRLEYFCLGLAGSVSDAVRRNWLALEGEQKNARNVVVALFTLCVEHMAALVSKAEAAVRASRLPFAELSTDASLTQTINASKGGENRTNDSCQKRDLNGPPSEVEPNHARVDAHVPRRSLQRGLSSKGFEPTSGGKQRKTSKVGEHPAPPGENSNGGEGAWSATSDGVGGISSVGIESFLQPEEEQIVQVLFRAILSLLSVMDGLIEDIKGNRTMDSNFPLRNRWGSFSRAQQALEPPRATPGVPANSTASGRLDEILWLCCCLLECGPGDGVLHLSLLVVGKILSTSKQAVNPSVLEGLVPAVASFLWRRSQWVKHACLKLLHRVAMRNDVGPILGLAGGSSSWQIIACLKSVDSGIRLAASNLAGVLAKDALYSKSIVFPESPTSADGTETADQATSGASRRPISLQPSTDLNSEEGSDVDDDFDVRQRSTDGCILPLLTMTRLGGKNCRRDAAIMEQEAALCLLKALASTNNLCREAIVLHGGVSVLVQAAEDCSTRSRKAIAGLFAELCINPVQRDSLKQAGGLLLLLQFQRSQDVDERIQAELALKHFGGDALSIHLSIAQASMEVVQRLFLREEGSTVGCTLLRPIHDRQLREAAKGLAVCAIHKMSAVKIMSEGGLPMLLDMLRVRDYGVQHSCIQVLLHLIRHNGEHFSETMSEEDRKATILQLACLVRPVRQRAARVAQSRLKDIYSRLIQRTPEGRRRHSSRQPTHSKGNLSKKLGLPQQLRLENIGQVRPRSIPQLQRVFPSSGAPPPGIETLTTLKINSERMRQIKYQRQQRRSIDRLAWREREISRWYRRTQGCVALALGGNVAEIARLASQGLELLASQSVTAANAILAHDVIESLTDQLRTYDMHGLPSGGEHGAHAQGNPGSTSTCSNGQSTEESKRRRAATRLQRQCIATLSSLALNSTGLTLKPSSRETVERGLLFLAAFHRAKSVRAEANLALRRLQSRLPLPHPASWSVSDCLSWLSCADLDIICTAAESFLSGGPLLNRSFLGPCIRNQSRMGVSSSLPLSPPPHQRLKHQTSSSGSASSARTALPVMDIEDKGEDLESNNKEEVHATVVDKRNKQARAYSSERRKAEAQDEGHIINHQNGIVHTTVAPGARRHREGLCGAVGLPVRSGSGSNRNTETFRIGTVSMVESRGTGTPGTRLLQMTRRDLLRSPFHASEETTTCFLRHLRALRLHAFVAAVMNRCGEDNKTRRRVGDRGGTYTDLDSEGMMEGDVSQWQERRYTLRKIEAILMECNNSIEDIEIKETDESVSLAASNTVEATDRFGSVLTLRLVRRDLPPPDAGALSSPHLRGCSNVKGQFHLTDASTFGRKFVSKGGWESVAAHPHNLGSDPTSSLGTGISPSFSSHQGTPAGRERLLFASETEKVSLMDLRGKRGYRDQEGRSRSGSNGFSNDEEGAYLGGTLGIKFVGRLADSTGMEVVEIYNGSLHQQAIASEATRVLSQPRNRGIGVKLVEGVAAVGTGRNSIGAFLTTSRPYKKVTLEMSANLKERECADPKGYISTTLAVIEDSAGISNLFVLDLCDTANIQDPRDGRTSLITAVLDNDETLVGRLLAEGVDIGVADKQSRTALLHSVIHKHDAITHLLLAHHSALVSKRLNERKCIRSTIARLNRGTRSASSKFGGWGTTGGGSSVPENVSDLQAMLDQRDLTGKAALHHAVTDMEERHRVLQALLAAKAQVNIRDAGGNSPLHIACRYGHVDIVKNLIKYNANTGSRNEELMTPLHIASLNLRIKIVSVLLKENKGAMVDAEDARGCTALHYACRKLTKSEDFTSAEDIDLIKEGAEEMVQQLLRHGADLHTLDKNASKPLDFRKYFEERRGDIMQAVQDTLEYRVRAVHRVMSSAWVVPRQIVNHVCGTKHAWNATPAQAMELDYHQSKQRFQAGRGIFSSTRVQEAVNEEWIEGGHRRRAVRILVLFVFYMGVFTLSAVLNSGRNMPHGFHLTQSIRSALERDTFLEDEDARSFGTVNAVDDVWEWMETNVIDVLYTDRTTSWYKGSSLVAADGWSSLRVLGAARLSQWRTTQESCQVWSYMDEDLGKYCFTDYCGETSTGRPICQGTTRDTDPFGSGLKYKYTSDAHKLPIKGSFGIYGPGAFVQNITQENRTVALAALKELEADGFFDEGTRALSLELALHSFSPKKFIYVLILVELPADGGVPVALGSYITFNTFNSFDIVERIFSGYDQQSFLSELGNDLGRSMGDRLTFQVDLALVALVLVNLAKEWLEFGRQGPYYFVMIQNLLDLLLIVGHVIIFDLYVAKSYALSELGLGPEDHYVDLRSLAELELRERLWIATMVLLVWIKLLDPLQAVFEDFSLLVKMIALMTGKLVKSFMPLLAIIYVAWAFARYTLLGQLEKSMRSVASTVANQYPEMLGDASLEHISEEGLYQSWRYVFTVLTTVVIVIVMFNLLVSMLNDLYEELKGVAKADWCKAQATAIYMNARWHSQGDLRVEQQRGRKLRAQYGDNDYGSIRCWTGGLAQLLGRGRRGGDSQGRGEQGRKTEMGDPPPSFLRLRDRVVNLGQEHLGFKDIENTAAKHATNALHEWNINAETDAKKGESSPLPPIEALSELRCLAAERDPKTTSMLLKGGVLQSLADVIGADGRVAKGWRKLGNSERDSGPPDKDTHGCASALRRAVLITQNLALSLTATSSSPAMERKERWNEARRTAIVVARLLVENPTVGRVPLDKQSASMSSPSIVQSGNDILRTMGGGYLVVTVLCTLSRAIPATTPMESLSFIQGMSGGSCTHTHGERVAPSRRNEVFGVAHEAEELLLLLAALLRLGCPDDGYYEGSPASNEPAKNERPPPPLISEVEAALAAAESTALRRRASYDEATQASFTTTGVRRKVGGMEERKGKGQEGVGCDVSSTLPATHDMPGEVHQISGRLEALGSSGERPTASLQGGRSAPGVFLSAPLENSARSQEAGGITSEPHLARPVPDPRKTSQSGRDYVSRDGSKQRSPSQENGIYLKGQPSPSNEQARLNLEKPSADPSSDDHAIPQDIRSRSARGVLSADAITRGKEVKKRVSTREFQQCGGGNFAVLLATRWTNKVHVSRDSGGKSENEEENGFDMLTRFAWTPSISPFSTLSQPTSTARSRSRQYLAGESINPWWNAVWDRFRPTFGVGIVGRDNGRWWITSRGHNTAHDGTRRSSEAPRWNSQLPILTEGSGAFIGTGKGAIDDANENDTDRLPKLVRGIIRDFFLEQVRSLMECTTPTYDGIASRGPVEDGPVRKLSAGWLLRRRSTIGTSRSTLPSDESRAIKRGVSLAYQVATGTAGGVEIMVHAGFVALLQRVVASAATTRLAEDLGASTSAWAVACLLRIVTECRVEDDHASGLPGLDGAMPGVGAGRVETSKHDAVGWRLDNDESPCGPVLPLSQALELAGLFLDKIVQETECDHHPGGEGDVGEGVAEASVEALGWLLRACEIYDRELKMSGIDARSGVGGVHDTMVDIIRRHRGYPRLEKIASISATTGGTHGFVYCEELRVANAGEQPRELEGRQWWQRCWSSAHGSITHRGPGSSCAGTIPVASGTGTEAKALSVSPEDGASRSLFKKSKGGQNEPAEGEQTISSSPPEQNSLGQVEEGRVGNQRGRGEVAEATRGVLPRSRSTDESHIVPVESLDSLL
ncbi:unnamed protein product [Ascophyllum nodosum]